MISAWVRWLRARRPSSGLESASGEELAEVSGEAILPFFRTAIAADDKAHGGAFDPVTEADRAAELAMRRLIADSFPHHGVGLSRAIGLSALFVSTHNFTASRTNDQAMRTYRFANNMTMRITIAVNTGAGNCSSYSSCTRWSRCVVPA